MTSSDNHDVIHEFHLTPDSNPLMELSETEAFRPAQILWFDHIVNTIGCSAMNTFPKSEFLSIIQKSTWKKKTKDYIHYRFL